MKTFQKRKKCNSENSVFYGVKSRTCFKLSKLRKNKVPTQFFYLGFRQREQ